MSIESIEDPQQAAPETSSRLTTQTASGALWTSFESIGTQLFSLAVFAVIARFISPTDFGLISITFVVLQTLRPIILEGIAHCITLKPSCTADDYNTAFWMTMAASGIAFGIMFLLSDPAEHFFHAPGLTNVMKAMSLITLFAGLSRTHEVWLSKHFQFQSLALRGLAGAFFGGLIGVTLAWAGYGVDALVIQQLVNSGVALLLLWAVCPWHPRFRLSLKTAAEIFHFQVKVSGNALFWLVNQNCDTFLVAYFYGPAAAGIYALAKRLRLAILLAVSSPISNVLAPALASASEDPERLNQLVMKALGVTCAVCAPLYLGAAAIAEPLIGLIFGPKWHGVAPFFSTLCVATLAGTIIDYNDLLLLLHKKQVLSAVNQLSYLVLSIGLFFMAQHVGITNYALPFALPYLLVLPLSIAILSIFAIIRPGIYVKRIFLPVTSALIMVVVIAGLSYLLVALPAIVQLFILICSGAAAYILALWLIDKHTFSMVLRTGIEILSPVLNGFKTRSSRYWKPVPKASE